MFFWLSSIHPLVYMYFPYISIVVGVLVLVLLASFLRVSPLAVLIIGHVFPIISYLSYKDIVGLDLPAEILAMTPDFVYSYRIVPFLAMFTVLYYISSTLTVLLSQKYIHKHNAELMVMMLATYGASVLVITTSSLITLYLAVEMLAILSYIMMGMYRPNGRTLEAILKYFLMGLVGTAFMLMGLSTLMYVAPIPSTELFRTLIPILESKGVEGFENYARIFTIGFVLFMTGLLFKIAVVPFHAWSVDVYQAVPSSMLIFVGMLPKLPIIIFILFIILNLNLDYVAMVGYAGLISKIIVALLFTVVLSLALPPAMALVQTSVKRLLGYSSIFNVGIIVMMILTGATDMNILSYIFAYTVALLGAFIVLDRLEDNNMDVSLDALSGLFYRSKFYAIALTTFLFSMLGMPLTMGFWVKIAALKNIVIPDGTVLTLLVVAFLIGTIVLIAAYVRTVGTMFFYSTGVVVSYKGDDSSQYTQGMNVLAPTAENAGTNANADYNTIHLADEPMVAKVVVFTIGVYVLLGAVYPNAITLFHFLV